MTESLSEFHRRLAENRMRQIAAELDPRVREQKLAVHAMCNAVDAGASILSTPEFDSGSNFLERV